MLKNPRVRRRFPGSAPEPSTADRLLDGAEAVICRARVFTDVTVRAIAAETGANVSAIAYHFGSLEGLVAAVAARVYDRLNAERLADLKQATDRSHPDLPPLDQVIAALVGPSVRWSLDPHSPYPVLTYLNRMLVMSEAPENYEAIIEKVDHHRAFVHILHRLAPWFDRVEIGWRLNAALGIRSQVLRQRRRSAILTEQVMDLSDPQAVTDAIVDVILPMFAPPDRRQSLVQTPFERRHHSATKRS
mgnify:CR=1 FL=1